MTVAPVADFAVADVAIAALVLISAGFGIARGLVKEVLSLAIWATALLLALAFGPAVAAMIGLNLAPRLQTSIGFVVVFVVVLIAGAIAQRLVGGLVKSTGLSGTDRLLGLIFGTARGGAVVVVGLIALRPFAEERGWWRDSQLVPLLLAYEADMREVASALLNAFSDVAETADVPIPATISNLPAGAALAAETPAGSPTEAK